MQGECSASRDWLLQSFTNLIAVSSSDVRVGLLVDRLLACLLAYRLWNMQNIYLIVRFAQSFHAATLRWPLQIQLAP